MPIFDVSASYARAMLARRAEQDSLFGVPLRGTIAWDMLLVLYVADAESRRLTVGEVIQAVGVKLEPGRRWLSFLHQAGLVISDGDATGDPIVTLTPYVLTRLESYIEDSRQSAQKLA